MNKKSGTSKDAADKLVRGIKRKTRKRAAFDLIGEVEVTDGALTVTVRSDGEKPVGLNGLSVWETSGDLDDTFVAGSISDDLEFA